MIIAIILLSTVIILAQALAIFVHAHLLRLERKYCQHCDWWWDTGANINVVITLIPVLGLFPAIAGCVDYTRNILEELDKKE
jgi:hypothetical protein